MPTPRMTMTKIREILRLHSLALSQRQIARAARVSLGTVCQTLQRLPSTGKPIAELLALEDLALAQMLAPATPPARASRYVAPDTATIHQEMRAQGMTLQLLWEEYRDAHGKKAYSYTQFCLLYRQFRSRLKRSLRQTHVAGEKCFTDYAGPTVSIIDARTGEIRKAQIFVAVLGASNYTYCEATWTQGLRDWVASHTRMLTFFQGVSAILVPDNLKAAVTEACRYEPVLNKTAEDFARHYGTVIIPARPYKPKDKAKVEGGVLIVERWILARLRHHTFFSLVELNRAVKGLLKDLNTRPFKKLPGTREEVFLRLERPALKPLPASPYEYATWKIARVHIDTHVEVEGHYYSVPQALVREAVDVRITDMAIEIFHKQQRVASHMRSHRRGAHTTVVAHLPKAHRKHLEWSPERLLAWGTTIGPATRTVVDWQLTHKSHPEQGYRACLGLLSLSRSYGATRLEAACRRAVELDSLTRKSVLSILKKGLDRTPAADDTATPAESPTHANIRGPGYYQ